MGYEVTAGFVTVTTAVSGGRAAVDVAKGQLLPADVPDAEVQTLLDRGDVASVDEPDPEPFEDTKTDPEAVPAGSTATVLEWVGSDVDRARRALEVEQAEVAHPARKGLVTDLNKLIEA